MKLLLQYLKGHKKLLAITLCLAFINQFFSLLDPQIFRLIIDRFANRAGQFTAGQFLGGVLLLLLASVTVALISRIAKNFQDYNVNVVTQKVGTELYAASVRHALNLPFEMFEDQRSGELLQKLQKARLDSQNLIASSINVVFLSTIGVLFVLIYAFIVHWTIGLSYFILIPVLGISTFLISRKIKKAQAAIVAQSAELAGSTTETLRNVELVKSLGLEKQETDHLNLLNDKILALELQKVKYVRMLSFFQGTFINTTRTLVLLLMLWLIFNQAITLGEFFSLFVYSFFIFNPLTELATVASQFQEARASLEQLQKVLDIMPPPKPEQVSKIGKLESIAFKELDFIYQSIDLPSLSGISLEIKSGLTAAFVGPSGSGKSTLLKVLVGLYRPSQGQVLVNGLDLNNVEESDFRRRLGYVSQETQLFAGTVRENLLFVNPKASDDDCLKALKQASALPIIERGGKGLETKIGEGGIKISGGERQRLAIARALLRDPELIIFDEATSSLDSVTEKSITETIIQISKYRPELITVLVAHRLSTIAHADKIFVLQKGAIIEEGNHQELMDEKGLYFAMWREQGVEKF